MPHLKVDQFTRTATLTDGKFIPVVSDPPEGSGYNEKVTLAALKTYVLEDVEVLGSGLTHWIDVTDPLYGAVGDGTTDDTAAVAAASAALAALLRTDTSATNDGRGLGTGVLYFPAGSYKITDTDAIIANAVSPGRGYVVMGDGREVTQIMFAPTTAKYLLRNVGTGWMFLKFSDLTFTMENANASLMNTDSGNNQRDYTFERVNFKANSTSSNGFRNTAGSDNYDTLTFIHCGAYGTWGTFFRVETTDLAICHSFYDCTWEVAAGNMVRLDKGGNVNWIGGSIVQVGAGLVWDLNGASHSDGTCRLTVFGTRVELRAATSLWIDSEWATGTISFKSVDQGAFATDALVNTVINSTFGTSTSSTQPIITWEDCTLIGRHEYKYANATYQLKQIVTYKNCEIRNYPAAADFIVTTDAGGAGVVGGKVVARFDRCRGSDQHVFDTDVNWQVSTRGETSRKLLSVKYGYGTNPFNGGYEEFVLPKNAVVIGAGMYAPATGWTVVGGSTTGFTLTFQTTEVSPTVLLQVAPGSLPSAGFNERAADDLFHVCDSDLKRTIRLVADANIKDYTTGFYAWVEYIG